MGPTTSSLSIPEGSPRDVLFRRPTIEELTDDHRELVRIFSTQSVTQERLCELLTPDEKPPPLFNFADVDLTGYAGRSAGGFERFLGQLEGEQVMVSVSRPMQNSHFDSLQMMGQMVKMTAFVRFLSEKIYTPTKKVSNILGICLCEDFPQPDSELDYVMSMVGPGDGNGNPDPVRYWRIAVLEEHADTGPDLMTFLIDNPRLAAIERLRIFLHVVDGVVQLKEHITNFHHSSSDTSSLCSSVDLESIRVVPFRDRFRGVLTFRYDNVFDRRSKSMMEAYEHPPRRESEEGRSDSTDGSAYHLSSVLCRVLSNPVETAGGVRYGLQEDSILGFDGIPEEETSRDLRADLVRFVEDMSRDPYGSYDYKTHQITRPENLPTLSDFRNGVKGFIDRLAELEGSSDLVGGLDVRFEEGFVAGVAKRDEIKRQKEEEERAAEEFEKARERRGEVPLRFGHTVDGTWTEHKYDMTFPDRHTRWWHHDAVPKSARRNVAALKSWIAGQAGSGVGEGKQVARIWWKFPHQNFKEGSDSTEGNRKYYRTKCLQWNSKVVYTVGDKKDS